MLGSDFDIPAWPFVVAFIFAVIGNLAFIMGVVWLVAHLSVHVGVR